MTPPAFTDTRSFNAPITKLWEAWTNPELFAQWYGPGVETKIHKWSLTPGDSWSGEMVMQPPMRFGGTITEVTPKTLFAFTQASADENWELMANPMMPGWPKFMLTHVTLKDKGETTEQTMIWSPHEASTEEITMFESMKDRMGGGWGKGFELLASLVEG